MRIATTPSNTLRIAASAIEDESEPVAGIVPRDLCDAELIPAAVLCLLADLAKATPSLDAPFLEASGF
ncbi:hypothetical protein ACMZ7W_03400 [Gardnerella vaginalis]|uniref:hypothetical protein n=1 Tax=Gardnerella vaginalis TaxID=2702 RepID=UPI0039EF5D2B